MTCPICGTAIADTDQFCEGCGTPLDLASASVTRDMTALPPDPIELGSDRTHFVSPPKPTDGAPSEPRQCTACGGIVADDGYCTECGLKAQSERDHWAESPAPWVGAVCDRGIRHARNEDGMATGAHEPMGSFAALVVCDGVSTSTRSDLASLNAARAARDVLMAAAASAPTDPVGRAAFWGLQLPVASEAANREAVAAATAMDESANPPSCTFVATVVHDGILVSGWAGDSRAYWLPDGGPGVQLSIDDSWATEQIALGVPREVAEADSRAHAITRWLGTDSASSVPRCSSLATEGRGGWVLVCSDGLWNYCSPADDLRALIDGSTTGTGAPDPVAVASALVDWANAQGGHDNISVALARVEATGAPRAGEASSALTAEPTIATVITAEHLPPPSPPDSRP